VVLSEQGSHIGKFFGQIEGAIMEAMIDADIFKNITVYDLQGLCKDEKYVIGAGSMLLTVCT
jgi:hypothetical protein